MAFTVEDVIQFARRRVFDTRATQRYSDADYVDGLNQGISTMMEMKPEIFGQGQTVQLAPGVLQSIPSVGTEFITLTRNMGEAGEQPGSAIRPVTRTNLDTSDANWPSSPANGTVVHFFPAEGSMTDFYVWPPQPDPAWYAEVWFAVRPPLYSAADKTAEVAVRDQYMAALGNFAASFVLMTDDENPETTAKAQKFFDSFVALVGPEPPPAEG